MTPLYQIINRHLESFIAARSAEARPLPEYVYDEFRAFLKCGILDHGFIRLKCQGCGSEMVVAFSCKLRGFCPSCSGRRMAEAAAHLVDHILPKKPYRQYVVTFLFATRYWLAANKSLERAIHHIIITEIHKSIRALSGISADLKPTAGAVSFTQRWGSALNLNIHYHILFTDGVFYHPNRPKFRKIRITDKVLEGLLAAIVSRTISYLKRQGFLGHDGLPEDFKPDSLFEDHKALAIASRAASMSRVAFGPNAGKPVTRIGRSFGYKGEIPLAKGALCYTQNGFSLHAVREHEVLGESGLW